MTKQIASLKRVRNSAGGSPVFEVTFTDGQVARTARDAQVGYSIENSDYQGVPLEVEFVDGEIVRVVAV